MWSGPRNISTAMMRAWENRPDTVVVDEPFYAAYLAAHRPRPSRSRRGDRLAADRSRRGGPAAGERRLRARALRQAHDPPPLRRHGRSTGSSGFRNVLLIRDPAEVVASYVRSRESCEPEDIGLLQQVRLLDALPEPGPRSSTPATSCATPRRTCAGCATGWASTFTDRMLQLARRACATPTASGRRTGTTPSCAPPASSPGARAQVELSEHDAAVAETCRPAYDALHARRLVL